MKDSVSSIRLTADRIRESRRTLLAELGPSVLQERVANALCSLRSVFHDPKNGLIKIARRIRTPYCFEEVWPSLDALLKSLTPHELWALADRESVRGKSGVELMGHIIAGNTPLLAWTSAMRALLVGSGSLIKLPNELDPDWTDLFVSCLRATDPAISELVKVLRFSSGDDQQLRTFCNSVDLITVYGDNLTIDSVSQLVSKSKTVVGYGHRVSFSVVDSDDVSSAALGLARDILTYDQQGCLSPHTIFVVAKSNRLAAFVEELANSLDGSPEYARSISENRVTIIRDERLLASMDRDMRVIHAASDRWTIVVSSRAEFFFSPTHGVVYITESTKEGIMTILSSIAYLLQGASIATDTTEDYDDWLDRLGGIGVSYICQSGRLQMPPLSWRENGCDVLRSFLPNR